MPAGADVRPHKWSNVIDLFDDGGYSAIWGNYDSAMEKSLGVRWNGNDRDEPYGYPSQGGYSVWYVEPRFLTRPLLQALLNEIPRLRSSRRREQYHTNIAIALSELEG